MMFIHRTIYLALLRWNVLFRTGFRTESKILMTKNTLTVAKDTVVKLKSPLISLGKNL